jgi:hypothetical protein
VEKLHRIRHLNDRTLLIFTKQCCDVLRRDQVEIKELVTMCAEVLKSVKGATEETRCCSQLETKDSPPNHKKPEEKGRSYRFEEPTKHDVAQQSGDCVKGITGGSWVEFEETRVRITEQIIPTIASAVSQAVEDGVRYAMLDGGLVSKNFEGTCPGRGVTANDAEIGADDDFVTKLTTKDITGPCASLRLRASLAGIGSGRKGGLSPAPPTVSPSKAALLPVHG